MACSCVGTQAAAAGILIAITFVFGFLPLLMKNFLLNTEKIGKKTVDGIVSVSLVFGAGVLFSTSVQHMLFETREGIESSIDAGFITGVREYPLAELFFCIGFILIYAFEELILYLFIKGANPAGAHSHSQRDSNSYQVAVHHSHGQQASQPQADPEANRASDCQRTPVVVELEVSKNTVESKVSFLRTVIFMFALYMHTLFEGLAIGIAESPSEVWILTGAISAHKIFIAFSTGNELLSQSKKMHLISITLLAVMPTLGTILGVVLAEEMEGSEAGDFVLTFLTGLSGGVILFVVFCEILEKERSKDTGRVQNMIAFSVGFACMALIFLIPEGEHAH